MKKKNLRKALTAGAISLGVFLAAFIGVWRICGQLMSASNHPVPDPEGIKVTKLEIPDANATRIAGWWLPADDAKAAVLLVHGIRADRRSLVARAKFYHRMGYSILMIDLPGHGESGGKNITFGKDEGVAIDAALKWIQQKAPGLKVGANGISLGGASLLLRKDNTGFSAIVIESVFPDIESALMDRLRLRLGVLAPLAKPFFLWQLKLRLGIDPSELSPMNRIADVGCPVLILGGETDQLTTLDETSLLHAQAKDPRELFIFPGCGHIDLMARRPTDFKKVVGKFFSKYLSQDPADGSEAGKPSTTPQDSESPAPPAPTPAP